MMSLILGLAVVASSTAPSYSLKGIEIGAPIEAVVRQHRLDCNQTNQNQCAGNTTVGGANALLFVYRNGSEVEAVQVMIFNEPGVPSSEDLLNAAAEKYGPATSVEQLSNGKAHEWISGEQSYSILETTGGFMIILSKKKQASLRDDL